MQWRWAMVLAVGALLLARACRDDHATLASPDHPFVSLVEALEAEQLPARAGPEPTIEGRFDDVLQSVVEGARGPVARLPEGRVAQAPVWKGEGTADELAARDELAELGWRLVEASRLTTGPVDYPTRMFADEELSDLGHRDRELLSYALRAVRVELAARGVEGDAELRPRCPAIFGLVRDLQRREPWVESRMAAELAAAALSPCVRAWSDAPAEALAWSDALYAQGVPRLLRLRLLRMETLAPSARDLPASQQERLPTQLPGGRAPPEEFTLGDVAQMRARRSIGRTWLEANLETTEAVEEAWARPSHRETAAALRAIELPEPPASVALSLQSKLVDGRAENAWGALAAQPFADGMERGHRLPWALLRAALHACTGGAAVDDPRTGVALLLDRSSSPPRIVAPKLGTDDRVPPWARARSVDVPCAL